MLRNAGGGGGQIFQKKSITNVISVGVGGGPISRK